MNNYFDQILGEQYSTTDLEAQEAVKNYILNHPENLSKKTQMDNLKFSIQIEMWQYLNGENKKSFIPTGEFLEKLLAAYKISKTRFAEYIELERTNLHAIIKGKRKFNSTLAKKIEQIFKIPAILWLQIETKNELVTFDQSKKLKTKYSLKKLMHNR